MLDEFEDHKIGDDSTIEKRIHRSVITNFKNSSIRNSNRSSDRYLLEKIVHSIRLCSKFSKIHFKNLIILFTMGNAHD